MGQLFYWRHACCVLVSSNILHEVANQPRVSITSANRLAHNCVQIAHACSVAMDYIAWVYRPTREAALDLSLKVNVIEQPVFCTNKVLLNPPQKCSNYYPFMK